MNEGQVHLKERMSQLSDIALVQMFDRLSDYTEEAIQVAREEVSRRGGLEELRKRVAQELGEPAQHQSPRWKKSAVAICAWMIPAKDRFRNYPILRLFTVTSRVLALLGMILVIVVLFIGLYSLLTPGGSLVSFISTFIMILYVGVLIIVFLGVSEIAGLLVDMEREIRQTSELLRSTIAGK